MELVLVTAIICFTIFKCFELYCKYIKSTEEN